MIQQAARLDDGNSPAPGSSDSGSSFADPAFVLCNARSGSTLLRFLLDAHPELSCPPETNLPILCGQLANVWSLIEGAPLSPKRDDQPPDIPSAAIAGVRATMDSMLGPYLNRRGKKRYCDKTLGTARFAALLQRIYPQVRFICLYRYPMDVIASAVEACPWGLSGYGFDPYIASTPGNSVLAVARFWIDNATSILAVEEQFADQCLRVRYEDLVANPEETAARLFDFLDAAPAPGISKTCFSGDRERFGPADHKIWYTSQITADSVGRGWSIPAAMLPPQIIAEINVLAERLGYLAIDGDWGTTEPPADLRCPAVGLRPSGTGTGESDPGAVPAATSFVATGEVSSASLRDRLDSGLAAAPPSATERWGPYGSDTMVAVWLPGEPGKPAEYWLVDLKARTVSRTTRAAQESSDWDIVGSADAWEQVLAGKVNLSVAFRGCQLRYCDGDDSSLLARDARIRILADVMGLTDW